MRRKSLSLNGKTRLTRLFELAKSEKVSVRASLAENECIPGLLSDSPDEFFGYAILYKIADTDVGIEDWDPQKTTQSKSILEHWICSQSRKDFLEEVADRHVDALHDLSRKCNALQSTQKCSWE